ncbi:electron transport complex, RnfABCDGE type, G subunit [Coprococcus comes ATCC 27758]|uniref:Electron transport complex, RnfABCDGE type, G subunit n=1 Tax=Coprococcus comes ATCC 27758 TaxID=470146 RepID=C0BBN0_9FIRM|nr:electron transport complex, RnfABCDGE type, G subunit [Coprococcus comes ATCC 27758]
MNKIIKNTLILAAITVVSGLVLGAAYEVTKGPIAQTQAKQKQEACQAVYPEADSFEAMDVDQKAAKEAIKKMGTNATVDEVYSAVMDGSEAGYVITVTDKDGYGGDIQITVGIMSDGTVNGISFLSISETAGLGMRAKEPSFYNQFAGQQAEKILCIQRWRRRTADRCFEWCNHHFPCSHRSCQHSTWILPDSVRR